MRSPPDSGEPGPGQARPAPVTSPPATANVHKLARGGDGGTEPAPLSAVVTDLLAYSDLMDATLRLRLAAWREGYSAGYERGVRDGRAQAEADDEAWWRELARQVAHGGPSYAELERRRYGPGGRLSWIRPRPGDDAA